MNDNAIIFSYDTRVDFWTFWGVIGIGILLLLIYFLFRYSKSRKPELWGFLLAEYVCIFLLLAVFLRETPIYPDGFTKTLWGDKSGLVVNATRESIFNILVFIPIGALLCNIFSKNKYFSDSIDDVIFNVIGLLIGVALSLFSNK